MLEQLLSASEDNYLDVSGRHVENVEDPSHPPVVREHKSVIEHDGCGMPLLDQHFREDKADEYGDLLLWVPMLR